jgi:hypothetical protein
MAGTNKTKRLIKKSTLRLLGLPLDFALDGELVEPKARACLSANSRPRVNAEGIRVDPERRFFTPL